MKKQNSYCCKILEKYIPEEEVPLFYDPVFREYNIKLLSPACLSIDHCPWCGTKLPLGLRDEFFDIMENELGIDDGILEIFDNKNLPNEFKSDEWWKKRNL